MFSLPEDTAVAVDPARSAPGDALEASQLVISPEFDRLRGQRSRGHCRGFWGLVSDQGVEESSMTVPSRANRVTMRRRRTLQQRRLQRAIKGRR